MSLAFELFSTASAPPDDLWAVVGDPARLPEWTDAEEVRAPSRPLETGDQVVTMVDGAALEWEVVTAGERIWEARAGIPVGELAFGARVAADPRGSRLILACALEPSGSRLVARAVTLPRLRSRGDRWSAAAVRRAKESR